MLKIHLEWRFHQNFPGAPASAHLDPWGPHPRHLRGRPPTRPSVAPNNPPLFSPWIHPCNMEHNYRKHKIKHKLKSLSLRCFVLEIAFFGCAFEFDLESPLSIDPDLSFVLMIFVISVILIPRVFLRS